MAQHPFDVMRDRVTEGSTKDPATGCWVWRGHLVNGYGVVKLSGRRIGAHRAAYIAWNGPVPRGKVLDHLCRKRACVNPAHLEVVTFTENVLRGIGPTAENARKTHCVHGHVLEGDNLLPGALRRGRRVCRTCDRTKHGRRRQEMRQAQCAVYLRKALYERDGR